MEMQKTYVVKGRPEREWLLVDAAGQPLGRLATQIAAYLLGKHKPIYTPGAEVGDFVVVVNAARVRVNSRRLGEKVYYHHSGYPGGMKAVPITEQLRSHPERVLTSAVWGMLPHNKLGRQLLGHLKVYTGEKHEQMAQKPRKVN
jgi:large subunit ribosomal protein L13